VGLAEAAGAGKVRFAGDPDLEASAPAFPK
jgi:hypothetical protein